MNKSAQKVYQKYKKSQLKIAKYKEDLYRASQYKLMWHKFKKHKVAQFCLIFLALFYLISILAEFVAPYELNERDKENLFSPPMTIRIYDDKIGFTRPFVYGLEKSLDTETFTYQFEEKKEEINYLKLFVKSPEYDIFSIHFNTKLFGLENDKKIYFFGTDKFGQDIFSQTIYGSRVSLFIGLAGVIISFIIGSILGGISGFYGGKIDEIIQRVIDFVISIPQIPFWMALSAGIPNEWTGIQTFLAITVILSLVGWTGLARVVRGKIISLREEDYVLAAKICGATNTVIITKHLIPGFLSYLIVHITLAIPQMILAETALSFLGLGILPPDVSWGSLLKEAQNLTLIAEYPWYLIPCIFVIVTVLAFNFIGDGLRDAADPYT
jgi:peptide/nickel transport system permease protein